MVLTILGMTYSAESIFFAKTPEIRCARECQHTHSECLAECDARKVWNMLFYHYIGPIDVGWFVCCLYA